MKHKNTLPSILTFEKRITPSIGTLFSGHWQERDNADNWTPVKIMERMSRGTINTKSRYSERISKMISITNSDSAFLFHEHNTLKVEFSLLINNKVGVPHSCNEPEFLTLLEKKVNQYSSNIGFRELSHRYASNLANGRFLWRNRVGAEEICIIVSQEEKISAGDLILLIFHLNHLMTIMMSYLA